MRRKSYLKLNHFSRRLSLDSDKENYPSRDDPLVNLNRLVSEERRVTGRHFVHKNTEGPPVHSFVVTLKKHHRIRILKNLFLGVDCVLSKKIQSWGKTCFVFWWLEEEEGVMTAVNVW